MKLAVLPGDGIGPEITDATLTVLDAVQEKLGLTIDRTVLPAGLASLETDGTTLPDSTFATARDADGVILGPCDSYAYPARDEGGINLSQAFRNGLDLFANIRPAKAREGLSLVGKPMDLVIVRENTEGFYADRNMFLGNAEFMPTDGVALSVRKITRKGSTRIAEAAFKLAAREGRKKVTAVHKANVLKVTDGLFLESTRSVARDYPGIELEEVIVDAMAALLVRRPESFDVVVTTNMYGDILSDLASEISGSLGLAPSVNAGDGHGMAQAQHGAAPDIAGQDKANPTSLLLSTAMLFQWIAERRGGNDLMEAARLIGTGVEHCLEDVTTRTADLGGGLGTRAFAAAVAARIRCMP